MLTIDKVKETGVKLLDPRNGYDLIAPYYEEWHWFRFWRLNEAPIIEQWLGDLKPGFGLDAGSGTGPYIPCIIQSGHRCVAFDLSWQMLSTNREKTNGYTDGSPVLYMQGKIDALPFRDSQFDWILCSRVLSHASHITSVLREFARVLKKHGVCLISDVHPEHPYNHVEIPMNGTKVGIKTYKHSIEDFGRVVSSLQDFQLLDLDEYHLKDLCWQPPEADFGKLYYHSNPAVFYVSRLKKLL